MTDMPLIIHDLQDSQMFALAQVAGRAGIPVSGTSWPMEGWLEHSIYIQNSVEMRCLSEVITAHYARDWKLSGLSGVWLPCVDDVAEFTAKYQDFLKTIGMRFLIPTLEVVQKASELQSLADVEHISIAPVRVLTTKELLAGLSLEKFPLMIKNRRNGYRKIEHAQALSGYLMTQDADAEHRVQKYITGSVSRMASAMLLFDRHGKVVRGFTGRRLSVADTRYGAFGETLSAQAEWIPELYAGACELLGGMGWQGFAEVECKQAADGRWYVMEINPRVSGWMCLAEADGAGLLQAYYQLCAQDAALKEACLQHSKADYVRMITTCYHDPEWDHAAYRGIWKKCKHVGEVFKQYKYMKPWRSLGAWDARDLKASLLMAWRSLYRVWKVSQLRRKSD